MINPSNNPESDSHQSLLENHPAQEIQHLGDNLDQLLQGNQPLHVQQTQSLLDWPLLAAQSTSESPSVNHESEPGTSADALIPNAAAKLDSTISLSFLFGALVVAFLVFILPVLSPNFAAIANDILLEAVALLCAQVNGTLGDLIPSADTSSLISPTNLVATILWSLSLMLNVNTILLAALVKLWVHRYESLRDQHQYSVCKTKSVNFIIAAILPLSVFSYLFLFIIRLVVYLWDLSKGLAITLLVMGAMILIAFLEISHLSISELVCRARSSQSRPEPPDPSLAIPLDSLTCLGARNPGEPPDPSPAIPLDSRYHVPDFIQRLDNCFQEFRRRNLDFHWIGRRQGAFGSLSGYSFGLLRPLTNPLIPVTTETMEMVETCCQDHRP
ncbi:hypothetical protein BDP27DRAFT_1364994 [Rhodocollybia butyracea]|uniref:DUF6535 domain-containing protein n=1 Tax=Rhodocollybia butyracea TaxID=206335 RepID=A0A9P5U6X5_9AGAR|nr:hypothetical protein BDP27DRAFT_1364994 [Rhodocollybia butyracea]